MPLRNPIKRVKTHNFTSHAYHIAWMIHPDSPKLEEQKTRSKLFAYAGGFIRNKGGIPHAIGGSNDHMHMICSLPPTISISELVRTGKNTLKKVLSEESNIPGIRDIRWRDNYMAFSVTQSCLDAQIKYCNNQEAFHEHTSCIEEWKDILAYHGIKKHPEYGFNRTYHHVLHHFIWSTKNREQLIVPALESSIHNIVRQEFENFEGSVIEMNGMPDHLHALVKVSPKYAISDVMEGVKKQSSVKIGQLGAFGWQSGYGSFTVGVDQKEAVSEYIRGQKEHHKFVTYQSEVQDLMGKYRRGILNQAQLIDAGAGLDAGAGVHV
jgi:REP element-mobilizing transposase RayT